MLNEKRLTQIEASLTPKPAVLLWVRQEFQGMTFQEYVRWLVERPVAAAPRIRVERQVVRAIQAAMKGQDPLRIQEAARQAQMETDFLILLVNRTNSLVLDQSRSVWLRILGLLTMIFNGVLRDDDASDDLVAGLLEAAAELFALPLGVERIQARYFDGESILAKDVREGLDWPVMFLRYFIADLDHYLEEHGHPELVVDSEEFRSVVEGKASKKVLCIRALAKSGMLQSFGLGEAANAVLRPCILGFDSS
jgi:hypothetical protein